MFYVYLVYFAPVYITYFAAWVDRPVKSQRYRYGTNCIFLNQVLSPTINYC